MEKFSLEITLGNDAMQNTEDVENTLTMLGTCGFGSRKTGTIVDDNGNTVGAWRFN